MVKKLNPFFAFKERNMKEYPNDYKGLKVTDQGKLAGKRYKDPKYNPNYKPPTKGGAAPLSPAPLSGGAAAPLNPAPVSGGGLKPLTPTPLSGGKKKRKSSKKGKSKKNKSKKNKSKKNRTRKSRR